ncbi:MAG: nucleotide-binding protein [Bdellovibrionota bacterium]
MKHSFCLCVITMTLVLAGWSDRSEAFPGYGGDSKKGLSKASKARPKKELKVKTVQTGKVLETMDADRYTYVYIEQKDGVKIWAAGEQLQVGVGDTVDVINGQTMGKFTSKILKKTFDQIYFAPVIKITNQLPENKAKFVAVNAAQAKVDEAKAAAHGGAQPKISGEVVVGAGSVKKVDGGMTIKECLDGPEKLKDKSVKIRAKVTKSTANIMGKNWLHIKDGSGSAGDAELVVTTSATSQVGDTVVVSGKLSLNKDFGAGYFYKIIMEDASVAKE